MGAAPPKASSKAAVEAKVAGALVCCWGWDWAGGDGLLGWAGAGAAAAAGAPSP